MRIAILGGGFTGLTAAYYLQKRNHSTTLFEKESVLGGLAVGIKQKNWDWYLERAYHHLFSNDNDILGFAKEIGFQDIFFQAPSTDSLFDYDNNYRIFPVDTPQDFLKLPFLSWPEKFRSGAVLAFLKFFPHIPLYEHMTIEDFMIKTMGKGVWNKMWKELLRKKFGNYAENVLASFIWARITKRTKNLGYVTGGFQKLIDYVEQTDINVGTGILKGTQVLSVVKKAEAFEIEYQLPNKKIKKEVFDAVISTLPSIVVAKVGEKILPSTYIKQLQKLEYLHAVVMILETKEKLLKKTYWLNVSTNKIPIMGIIQHTNFIDKEHYGGNNILYVANYVDRNHPLIKMKDGEVFDFYTKYLTEINPEFVIRNPKYYVFKAPFAQPIFDKNFLKNKPNFETPIKNFYIANLDMTYPYDRGTNYAVKLGKEVAALFK